MLLMEMSVNRTLTPVMLVTPTWLFSDLSVVANIIHALNQLN